MNLFHIVSKAFFHLIRVVICRDSFVEKVVLYANLKQDYFPIFKTKCNRNYDKLIYPL